MFLDTGFLKSDELRLRLDKTAEGDPARDWVPAYHFSICDLQGNPMGTCDLRIGWNQKLYYGGHIGYRIEKEFRGHHYAGKACLLLFELAKKHGMDRLIITCNPDNFPSRKLVSTRAESCWKSLSCRKITICVWKTARRKNVFINSY